jgi:hypothetical protein
MQTDMAPAAVAAAMHSRTALAAAVLCAAAAVALVAADLAWNVEATLERMEGADWVVVARAPDAHPERIFSPSCVGNQFRLTLHNGLPWGTTVEVSAHAAGTPIEGWTPYVADLGPGESVTREFTVPASALTGPAPEAKTGWVELRVGSHHLGACAGPGRQA